MCDRQGGGRLLPRYRHFLPGCRRTAFAAALSLKTASAMLARPLRVLPIMTAVRSAILWKNKALCERGRRVAGQELRATMQRLPGRAGETRQCR